MGPLLVLLGIAWVLLVAPALFAWRLATWKASGEDLSTPATLKVRLEYAVFRGLLPGWGVGLVMLLVGRALSGRR
jgi:hypothetical protein